MKLKVTSIWYSDTVNPWRAWWLTEYQRSTVTIRRLGYIREMFYTKLIDLRKSEEQILGEFSRESRRLVRRAGEEGIVYDESMSMDEFVHFFNRFSRLKKLSYWLNAETLKQKNPNYRITRALKDGEVLFAHLYRCDDDKRRAVILYGGSILKDENHQVSNAVMRSGNRGLHFYDMCMLKTRGYDVYDMGGYAPDTTDPELKRINDFKDDFGGVVVCEANHRSVVLQFASTLLNFVVMGRQKEPIRKVMSFFSRARGS
jgi:hypothetical protein